MERESCVKNNVELINLGGDESENDNEEAENDLRKRQKPVKEEIDTEQKPPPASTLASGRKNRSPFWDHFERTDPLKVVCIYCKTTLTHKSVNGTTSLKNHLERCKLYPPNMDRKQKLIDFESTTVLGNDGKTEIVNVPKLYQFDPNLCRKECAKMIIIDELPFMFVEREGFRGFCRAMCPLYTPPSRSTVTRDCYTLFIDERTKLMDFFSKLSSRVCLTTDTWTSGQNLCYMCLTAHFIDDNWVLHKRIINFCPIAGHSGELIGRAVEKCLNEWNLKRILTCTVDNASANDGVVNHLKKKVNHWKGGVLESKYMHMRCAAHILNLVVKDGLKDLDFSIVRIRGAVRYVRSSPARFQAFKAYVKEENINTTSFVCLDVETRWNSTYLMLKSAVKFKDVFDSMDSVGSAYHKELTKRDGVPTMDDWNKVSAFLPFLHIFYEATLKLSGSLHVTANSYIPEIYGVGSLIASYCHHEDVSIRKMAEKMKVKHDKYWANVDNLNIFLFIALILDPRSKWKFMEWVVKDTYEGDNADMLLLTIKKCFKSLFECYDNSMHAPPRKEKDSATSRPPSSIKKECLNGGSDSRLNVDEELFNRFQKELGSNEVVEKKAEWEKYLSDELEPRDSNFDVLGWWKDSQKRRYPVLAKMAKDILAMPVSSVASESAFSTGGRVLDSFRTSLTPRMVEALICAQDWLRKSRGPLIIEESLLELEALEEGMKDLTIQQPTITIDESLLSSEETY